MDDLTKDDVISLAMEYYASMLKFNVVDGVNASSNIYRTWKWKDVWCVYVEKPFPPSGLFSSEVIIISKK